MGLKRRLDRMTRLVLDSFLRMADPVFRPLRDRRVVMFHHGRCGSTVLGMMLNEHPKVRWVDEPLKTKNISNFKNRHGTTDYREILRASEATAGLSPVFGFDIKPSHLREIGLPPEAFLEYLQASRYSHFVLLNRKNILRREVSSQVALSLGYYHLRSGSTIETTRISLRTDTLLDNMDARRSDQAAFERLLAQVDSLYITYEDDVQNNPMVAYEKISAFLNLPVRVTEPRLGRTNPFPLHDILANFDEVEMILSGTQYEWMLHE